MSLWIEIDEAIRPFYLDNYVFFSNLGNFMTGLIIFHSICFCANNLINFILGCQKIAHILKVLRKDVV